MKNTTARRRVLVVDDEISIIGLLRDGLTSAGFEVDAAESAREALDLVKENLYDVAIVDFALPDMNGVMLHHELRQMDPELAQRTLFISGRAQSEDDLSYFSSVASGFLSKPFAVEDVIRELQKLLVDPE